MIIIHEIWDAPQLSERDRRIITGTIDGMIQVFQEKEPHRTVTARHIANRIMLKCEGAKL